MYVVRDKKTKEIIHVNPAPLSQNLSGKSIYFDFDPAKMEIGRTDERALPDVFDINDDGDIVETQPEGTTGEPDSSEAAPKTLSEKVAAGLITLPPTQKIAGKGADEHIVEKSLSELVAEGLLELSPSEKLVGEEIVAKTLEEQIEEGLIRLDAPFQRIEGDQIAPVPLDEILEGDLLETSGQAAEAVRMVHREIEGEIAKHFTIGYELKISKDYMAWLKDGQPKGDPRDKAYRDMQRVIDRIRKKHKKLLDAAEASLQKLAGTRVVYHVVPDTESNVWLVRRVGGTGVLSRHAKKGDATEAATELAKENALSQVVIHKKDGTIQREYTYGEDPEETPG